MMSSPEMMVLTFLVTRCPVDPDEVDWGGEPVIAMVVRALLPVGIKTEDAKKRVTSLVIASAADHPQAKFVGDDEWERAKITLILTGENSDRTWPVSFFNAHNSHHDPDLVDWAALNSKK